MSDDGTVRTRARETLALMGEPAAEAARELLSSPKMRVRWEAAKLLAAMVDPSSVAAFVRLLDDPFAEVRWLAGDGLIRLGPRSVAPVLESLLELSVPLEHRRTARRVLRRLSSDNGVLSKIVGPVIKVLDDADPAAVGPRAQQALIDLDHITGRLPLPDDKKRSPDT